MRFKVIMLAIVALMAVASKCKQSDTASLEKARELIKEKLGPNAELIESPQGSYILALNKSDGSTQYPQNHISYLVYSLKEHKIVYEDSMDNGHVSWHSDYQLAIEIVPGIEIQGSTRDDYISVLNLKTGEKVKKKDL
ncbi:MAG: hypothetical protein AAFX87_17870 [Bacteroidota bacterium]